MKKIFLSIFSAVLSTVLISCARLAGTDSGKRDFSALPPAELRAAAEQGEEWAQYQLGRLYIDPDLEIYDLEKGLQYLGATAEQGNEWAEYRLGKLYLDPALNIYDVEKGIQYLEASAGQGNEWAGYALAKEYLDKSSAAYDPKKGMEYLSGLAEKGNEWAQVKMGFEYIKGEHVGQDISSGEPDCGMAVVGYARDNGRRRTLFGKFFPDGSGMHAGQR